ncbi:MAG: hypothetical protein IE933_00140 [Sphingomonadales bacterium]|nr:hypothetical protein [Sphingomonadales bacterium]MBD3772736.1 hypothetical protein [Paracoccaceae bacterium]
MRISLAAAMALTLAAPAMAQDKVALSRAVYVERAAPRGEGLARSIDRAESLRPGDRVVLMVEWQASEPGKGFTLSSPVPSALAFQRSSADGTEVSVDGGRNWGMLGTLRIGDRLASPEDVTNLRWRIPAREAARGKGRVVFSAFVR